MGISVRGLGVKDLQLISRLGEDIEYIYPAPLLAELLAKAAKEALKKNLKTLPKEAVEGLKALLAGLAVAIELPDPNSLALAAELWIKGHRDIMDDVAYAHAVKTKAYFMTLDESFRSFLSEKGYTLDTLITHKNLENVAT